jgi:hypothetical protein
MDYRNEIFDIEGRKPSRMAVFEMLLSDGNIHIRYPCWLYKDGCDPLKVCSEEEEKRARADGYDSVTATDLSNRHLINWFWDLEDMSSRQLRVFALEEYGVDLPAEADQDTLFKAVSELSRHAPQNHNRLVLMAHTIKMNYDATLDEIRRLIAGPQDATIERFVEEVYA